VWSPPESVRPRWLRSRRARVPRPAKKRSPERRLVRRVGCLRKSRTRHRSRSHITDGVETLLDVFGQAKLQHPTKRGRRLGGQRVEIRFGAKHRGEGVGYVFTGEGALSREHFVDHRAEGTSNPKVRAGSARPPSCVATTSAVVRCNASKVPSGVGNGSDARARIRRWRSTRSTASSQSFTTENLDAASSVDSEPWRRRRWRR